MNNLNALLKHPVLGLLPYGVLKNSGIEEIDSELRKLEKSYYRTSFLFIGFALAATLFAINVIWIGDRPSSYMTPVLFTTVLTWCIAVKHFKDLRNIRRCRIDLNGL